MSDVATPIIGHAYDDAPVAATVIWLLETEIVMAHLPAYSLMRIVAIIGVEGYCTKGYG